MTNENYINEIEKFIDEMKHSTKWTDEINDRYDELIQYYPESGDSDEDRPADDEITISDGDRFNLNYDEIQSGSEQNDARDRENVIEDAISQLKDLKKLVFG